MIRGLYTAVSGMITKEAEQNVVTNNLANSNTVGFKKDNLAIKKFDDVLVQNYDNIVNGVHNKNTLGKLCLGSKIDETNTSFSQGSIQQTGKSTDFAIDGAGFFKVKRQNTVDDKQYYTRDGHFHVNTDGFLVNDTGDYVLSNDGNKIEVGNGEMQSDTKGMLTITDENGNKNVIKLGVVNFEDYKSIKKVGDNLYETNENPKEANASIKQNALEKSNVNVINEMVKLMTVMRNFETDQKVVQTMDETLGKAVNQVGSVRG